MTVRDKLIEAMARGIFLDRNSAGDPDELCNHFVRHGVQHKRPNWQNYQDYASAALTALEATHVVVPKQNNDWACLSPEEQKTQGSRCGCLGADDYCVCQNVPDKKTLEARKVMIGAAHD